MPLNQKRKESELTTTISSSDEKKTIRRRVRIKKKTKFRNTRSKQKPKTKIVKKDNINIAIMISNLKKIEIQKYIISSQYQTIDKLMTKKGKSLKVKNTCKEFSLLKSHCKKNSKENNLNDVFFYRKRRRGHKFLADVLN